jgi:hypothetical protein
MAGSHEGAMPEDLRVVTVDKAVIERSGATGGGLGQ